MERTIRKDNAIRSNGPMELASITTVDGKLPVIVFWKRMEVVAATSRMMNPLTENPSCNQCAGRIALNKTRNPVTAILSSKATAIM